MLKIVHKFTPPNSACTNKQDLIYLHTVTNRSPMYNRDEHESSLTLQQKFLNIFEAKH